ncbi:ribokinase [Gilliamella apicola]|uniref:Ribokinase n=1 Tax=Gilliamella apicola TaxID=1196095 RepID=A0A242NKW3_9GAMM|nr:ribokinase [Gilliamella apicola]OTP83719.1 ribokinase [Gilliamella apicola]OTP86281.1 ribokinase [Gilliamella apicola]OTP87531.1 ribokinase [Gilliamella apicola]OTQ00982.1 ribokinase [Gilliamella apicola]OTQ10595.1 ribokinase [Gilliamella apicola]
MKGKVCVFGSFNLDITAFLERFPMPGESLVASSSKISAGGKGANQATAALKAGANVHYIGKIGEDDFGYFARRHLKEVGFNAVTILSSNERATGNALIYVAGKNAENMISVDPGTNMIVTEEEIKKCEPAIKCADVVLVQLENNLSAINQVIDIANNSNAFTILNPAPFQPVSDKLLSKVDLLTPNETEAYLLTGQKITDKESAEYAADYLHQKGVKKIIITMGAKGSLLSDHSTKTWIPCFPANPVDTTGAGDAFNGALAAQIANGQNIKQAALFSSAFAAVSVEYIGAACMTTYQQAIERMNKFISN